MHSRDGVLELRRYVPISNELSHNFFDITPTYVEVPKSQRQLGTTKFPAVLPGTPVAHASGSPSIRPFPALRQ